jgi:protein TonB
MRDTRTRIAAGLAQCMLDGDAEATSLSRRQRARSLVISVLTQGLFLTALVVAPLLAAGKIPLHVSIVTPAPPYHGRPNVPELKPRGGPQSGKAPAKANDFDLRKVVPPILPAKPQLFEDVDSSPSGARDPGPGLPSGIPGGVPRLDNTMIARMQPANVPPPVRPARIRITSMNPALLLHRVDPPYPPLARQARVAGEVRLRALIGRDGRIQQLELLSGHPLLARASLDAVMQWRYRPTLLNGAPVEVETTITIIFTLNR